MYQVCTVGKGHDFHSLGVPLVFLVAKVAKVAHFTEGASQRPVAYVTMS